MTFAEYNTDTNFDNDKSSLEELVKLGISEGKTSDEIKTSLSPKWQKSKKIGEFDDYFKKYSQTAPKVEEKPVEEKEEVKETVTDTSTPTLTGSAKKYNDKQNTLAEVAKKEMLNDIKKDSSYNLQELYDSYTKRADAYKNIDDHYMESLPTFIFRRYQNGEFGDTSTPEGKKDAKLRMAYFMINGVGTALQNASSVIKGGQMKESDYEKYKNANMTEGLTSRWNKNKADTEGAIKAVEKEFGNEQDARLAAEQFTRDQKASVKWNMMNQNQKIDALRVTKEIGDMLGGMNTSEIANFIAGAALTGDVNKEEVMAIGIAKLAANSPQILANLPEGSIKDTVMSMIGGNATTVAAGVGGSLLGDGEKKETGTTLEDGTKIDPGKVMSKDELTELRKTAEDLGNKLYNGEITEEQFRKDYAKLEDIMKQHGVRNAISGGIMSQDDYLKQIRSNKLIELSNSFDELQANAKTMSKKDYLEQYEDLKANAQKWGIDDKTLKTIEQQKDKTLKKLK